MIKLFFTSFIFLSLTAQAEITSKIDLNLVSESLKSRLIKTGADRYTSPNQFKVSCLNGFNTNAYEFNHMAFIVNGDTDEIWNAYMNSNPKTAWDGETLRFEMAYSKLNQTLHYRNDPILPVPHVGMGVFIDLKVFKFLHLPAMLEITKLDSINKTFEFSYLENNTSHGKQIVRFVSLGNGQTKIIHNTYFKSHSNFRDHYLYPRVHESLLQEFHQNVLNQIHLHAIRID